MSRILRRICVTGPECTGKTTLARRLAEELGVSWVPESARGYAERANRALTVDDVEPIAREHAAAADAAAEGSDTIVLDTDLVSTIIYGRHYYGFSSAWVEAEAAARQADLYLLCDVDVPWIPDGIRDQPLQRASLFGVFADELRERGASTVLITGEWHERWRKAIEGVNSLPA